MILNQTNINCLQRILGCFLPVFFLSLVMQAQEENVKGKSLFFSKAAKGVYYFSKIDGKDDAELMTAGNLFSLHHNYCNIYFKWLNPIRYKISWKDSVSVNESDKNAKTLLDYIGYIIPDYNNTQKSKDLLSDIKPVKQKKGQKHNVELEVPDGFNDFVLTDLYITLRSNEGHLSDPERKWLNDFSKSLVELDKLNAQNIPKIVYDLFQVLYNFETVDEASTKVSLAKTDDVKDISNNLDKVKTSAKKITDVLNAFELQDKLLNSSLHNSVLVFIGTVNTNLSKNSTIVSKLGDIIKQFDASFLDASSDFKDYYKVREIRYDNGKVLNTTMTISEYDYISTINDFRKKDGVQEASFAFKRYDFVSVSVSTGIFYGNTSLKNFGVSPSNNEFVVTEETVDKSSAVTAVFANINFNLGSRYFSPLIQVGVDPLKKKPFFLLGAGFSIPAVKLAISAGGIWSWNQSLSKITVGDKISSTTDLEKDLKSNFDVSPRGWYLGIQYNF
ncbi:MAG TPA: hypothetical protein VK645_04710 [Chitinophagaceae bacterium]|nr:hypothetical protein [Chitinophagaceae bacterium]